MNNQEQRKLSPPGREKNYICHKCGWTYPNPHPSAKHRRAHKKICGKPLGFKGADSDDDDDRQTPGRQTPVPEIDGVGGGPNKSDDEMVSDAVKEFSPVDSEKSLDKTEEDSGSLLKSYVNPDSASSPGIEGADSGLSDSDKKVERDVEVDLDSSKLLTVDAKAGSTYLDVGVVEVSTEDTKKTDKDEVDEAPPNITERLARNLSESFETDGNISPSKDDKVSQLELEQDVVQLKIADNPLEVESILQSETNSPENIDVSNNGDLEVSSTTMKEEEAIDALSVSEDITRVVGDSDNIIEDSQHDPAVESIIPLQTLDVVEVNSPPTDDDNDLVAQEVITETKKVKEVEVPKSIGGVVMLSESEPIVDSEVSEAPILKDQNSPAEDSQNIVKEDNRVNDGEVVDVADTEELALSEPKPGHLPHSSDHAAVEDIQHKDNEQVASTDISSQNSLEVNWGSASGSVQSTTPPDAQAFVDAETIPLSPPQEPTKSEESKFSKSEDASEKDEVNQSDTLEPPPLTAVVSREFVVDQNETEAARNLDPPKPVSVVDVSSNDSDAKKKNEAKHHHTMHHLKSLMGETDAKEGDQKTPLLQKVEDSATEKKGVVNITPPKYAKGMEKDWNSSNKKDAKKVKGKPSWIPFVCCSSSVNVS